MKSEIQKICEVHDDDSGKDNMESETRNRCEVQQDDDLGKDIISELPDELLHHILSCLPTKDIVRTSAFSTRWRWLWTFFTIVSVDFGAEDEDENDSASFLDLIQNKLLIPDTARIRKFRIHLHKYSHFYTYPNILFSISLVYKALKHQVEELELSFPHLWRCNMLSLPHTLFTSESLTSLKLHMSHAASVNPYPTSICFPRLKTLHLICIKFLDARFAELLFSGCLVLEELLLDNCYWNTTYGITIAIATLQRLAVYHYYSSSNNSLKIRCPNLQFLNFWSCSFFNLVLHLPSLIKAHVEIMPRGNLYQQIRLARSTLNLLERTRSVKSLRLSSETLKTISCAENVLADDPPTFHNLTRLKLIGGDCDLSAAALLHILHKSPKLQSIVFPHAGSSGLEILNISITYCSDFNQIMTDLC
ncbi:F-box domain - like 10 [Theobroma cacao]|nr:F-box domain - like 10 [Theobroma cacao]